MRLLKNGQICFTEAETKFLGEGMKPLVTGIMYILPGTVMVFVEGVSNIRFYFEVCETMTIGRLKDYSGIYVENGSILSQEGIVPNFSENTSFFYKRCRFPTIDELEFYNNNCRL